jgi:tetratricopeptide (TPR) repeat protein
MKHLQLLFCAVILLATSCKTEEKPVTKEQAAQFAGSIEKSVANKDEKFFNNAFDMDALMSKMKAAAPGEAASFWKGVKQGLAGKMNFGDKVIQLTGSKGSYSLVRQYQEGNKQHILFRLFSDGAINYHDFELVNKKDNIKIADGYMYLTGEMFSKTLKDVFEQVLKTDEASLSGLQGFHKVNGLLQKGEYKKAKEMIDRLPQNLKNTKAVQLRNIQVCSELDSALYNEAIDKFQHDFPADPSLNLVLLDGLIVKQKYTEAIACIDKLDGQVKGDPFLDYYRGLLYNLQGKKATAQEAFERLHKNMPGFSSGGVQLCAAYIDKGDYEAAAAVLKKIKGNRDFDEDNLQNLYMLHPKLRKYMTE